MPQRCRPIAALVLLSLTISIAAEAQTRPRARELGVPFEGSPGTLNAITDVANLTVGHVTIIEGEGRLVVGEGPIRTGVTAILPRGMTNDPVFAGRYALNGNGEMTGTTWVEESGFLEGPVMITNTHSVGIVHAAVIEWNRDHRRQFQLAPTSWWSLPVVAETWDGGLNDINGFHVTKQHTFDALNSASGGRVAEGSVGGGTGMRCHQWKAGIGTSSRIVGDYVIGVLVQCNYGSRHSFRVAGVPVGTEIPDLLPEAGNLGGDSDAGVDDIRELGSIIVVVATDAPLLPQQLKRIARRVPMGIGRVGGYASNGSGDIFIAFSTANVGAADRRENQSIERLPNDRMSGLFEATAQAVEEAIINAIVAGETMVGINGNTTYGIPHDRLREVLEKYNRLER